MINTKVMRAANISEVKKSVVGETFYLKNFLLLKNEHDHNNRS